MGRQCSIESSDTIGVQTGGDSYDGGNSFFTKEGGGSYSDSTSQDLAGTSTPSYAEGVNVWEFDFTSNGQSLHLNKHI